MAEDSFPRYRARRIPAVQQPYDAQPFEKRAAAHLDYSVDLSSVMEQDELVTAAYAWTSVPGELLLTWCLFSDYGAVFFVAGGLDGQSYTAHLHVLTNYGRALQYRAEITVFGEVEETAPEFTPPTLDNPFLAIVFTIQDVLSAFVQTYIVDSLDHVISPRDNMLTDLFDDLIAPDYLDVKGDSLFLGA